jgi:tetraacyldisaccharide 4'-kinase
MIDAAKYVMLIRRLLFLPATLLYGGILHLRHTLYDHGLLPRTRPTVPTIAIGNLSFGGTGKTPMLELVLRTLEGVAPVATLSRGYGRTSTGIHEVQPGDPASRSGDEPVQVKRKFPHVRVFVGADRVKAMAQIQGSVPGVKAVVLDDALQHRALDAGLNILLTTWQRPWHRDSLAPGGLLRDLPIRAKAAQVVVVTKCPEQPSEATRRQWRQQLRLNDGQALYFSGITYDTPRWAGGATGAVPVGAGVSALLFTGIADPEPLQAHATSLWGRMESVTFPDHHAFSPADLRKLALQFSNFAPGPNVLVTTEKDAARLSALLEGSPLASLPLAVIGMRAVILNEPHHFADLIRNHVSTHPAHR